MRAYPAALLALIAAFSGPLAADVIDLPAGAAVAPAQPLPAKGISMASVRQQFGAPLHKHPPVGGGSRNQPPITRWDYPGFAVFFEHEHVVHAVVPGRPPAVQHIDELKSATP